MRGLGALNFIRENERFIKFIKHHQVADQIGAIPDRRKRVEQHGGAVMTKSLFKLSRTGQGNRKIGAFQHIRDEDRSLAAQS